MKNIFNTVELPKPKKNTFDLTHDVKMSCQMGQLIPVCAIECVPTDDFTIGMDSFTRFAPMIAPVMHRFDVTCHYFFVPNRITWPNWEKYITNEPTGGMPVFRGDGAVNAAQSKFMDYMGVPPWNSVDTQLDTHINALPFAAYQKIYEEWYRDQNLITETPIVLLDGLNGSTERAILLKMQKRAWEHDYFTSSLPTAQKGTTVDIPLGDVTLKPAWNAGGNKPIFVDAPASAPALGNVEQVDIGDEEIKVGSTQPMALDPKGTLQVTPTTINDLRTAYRLQEYLERNMRGGTRYAENVYAHFGEKPSDKRLQRPEYITGTKSPVIISEVLNTVGNTGEVPQGTMAGHGVSIGEGYTGHYHCEEHGYIIGIMSIMPKPAYQQGIPKHFLRRDHLDFVWPTFANLGEQPVLLNEIYGYRGTDEGTVFGYVPKYAEMKYIPNRVAGDFRGTLNFWQAGRIFAVAPTLSQGFIEMNFEEVERIFAVNTEDNIYCHILNKIKVRRPLPIFGTPHM